MSNRKRCAATQGLACVLMALMMTLSPPQAAIAQETGGALGEFFRDVLRKSEPVPAPGTLDQGATVPVPAPRAPRQDIAVTRAVPQSRGDMMQSFSPLVKATAPAVVNVYAERQVERASPFGGDPFFEQFFGQRMPNRTETQSSLGSGVIVAPGGIIITNNHVIEGADGIRVALADGREFQSEVLLKDDRFDIAILKIDGPGDFPAIEFGDSDSLEVGDLVLAIGNPFGVGQTVTSGIISALARNRVGVSDFGFFIQTDAAINPGNSGGALIDMNGRLIGINTAIFSRSGGSNGIGFAIPANLVRAVTLTAEAGGDRFERPYIGATFEPVTADIAEALGLDRAFGALVSAVELRGPAAAAGLRPGDIVVGFNGQRIEHPDALGYRLATTGVGVIARIDVIGRDGRRSVNVTLKALPQDAPSSRVLLEGRNPFAGATVSTISPRIADEMRIPTDTAGVVVLEVSRQSLAARYGMRPRDIISVVNGMDIKTVEDLSAILQDGAGLWRFELIRNGQRLRQLIR